MKKTRKNFTEEEKTIILDTINGNLENLREAFEMAAVKTGRTVAVITQYYYTKLRHVEEIFRINGVVHKLARNMKQSKRIKNA